MKSGILNYKAIVYSLCFIMVVGVLAGFTQNPSSSEDPKAGLYKELLPVIKEKRAELDKSLSKKEKSQIAGLKKRLDANHDEMLAMRKDIADQDKGSRQALSTEQKTKLEALRWEHRKIMAEAFLLADSHQEEILRLTSEIQASAKNLRQNLRKENGSVDRKDSMHQGRHDGRGHSFNHDRRGTMTRGFNDPAKFILFDEQRANEMMQKFGERNKG